jgi:protoporphyrinogen oxidase
MKKTVAIIGAGPAGITAAYELLLKGKGKYDVYLFEESEVFGGISRTVNADGNYMDIGGHRFFSKDKRVTDWWDSMLSPQGSPTSDDILLNRVRQYPVNGVDPEKNDQVMLIRERVSRIYYNKAFFDYPVSLNFNTIKNMGLVTTFRAGFSYLSTLARKLPENNLENFYINRFGKVLYSMFFEGYTEKLWGRHPREISADWGAQRVKGLSISAVLKDIFGKIFHIQNRKVETSLIERFSYPKYGPGQLWTVVADKVKKLGGKVIVGAKVIDLTRNGSQNISSVTYIKDGERNSLKCNMVISSMAIKDLVEALDNVPGKVGQIARGLPYRDFLTVGVLVPQEVFALRNSTKRFTVNNIAPDCWIYIQDTSVKLGRIQVFNNWSPYLVKDFRNTVWIGMEYFCDEGDKYWAMSDADFIRFATDELVKIGVISSTKSILFTHREKVKKAYPAYFDTYSEFGKLREYLDDISNLWCVGRNGQHRYNNMDHSMMTAFFTVDAILADSTDKEPIWNINAEAEYHETKHD